MNRLCYCVRNHEAMVLKVAVDSVSYFANCLTCWLIIDHIKQRNIAIYVYRPVVFLILLFCYRLKTTHTMPFNMKMKHLMMANHWKGGPDFVLSEIQTFVWKWISWNMSQTARFKPSNNYVIHIVFRTSEQCNPLSLFYVASFISILWYFHLKTCITLSFPDV